MSWKYNFNTIFKAVLLNGIYVYIYNKYNYFIHNVKNIFYKFLIINMKLCYIIYMCIKLQKR